jgi:glycine/D-amino acid oxidase-like deaminating enzyme
MRPTEYAIVGGGLVGMAVAWGLQRRGRQVTVFDEGDIAFRAARGNFGLVWVQGKGVKMPVYARWTRLSASLWPGFADELEGETGVPLQLSKPGGLDFCLTQSELDDSTAALLRLRGLLGGDYPFERLDPAEVRKLVPEATGDFAGAIFGPEDRHCNPLYLLRALAQAFIEGGGCMETGGTICGIRPEKGGFKVDNGEQWRAERVVLCAGLGNAALAPMVGLDAPVRPNRGQLLITERVKPLLDYPSVHVRQTGEGTVQIGASQEDVGLDDGTMPHEIGKIAARAGRIFPMLENVRVVRSWGALRVMSPDGHPIYDESPTYPGAFVVTCHSGVTLAAVHALVLARWIAGEDSGIPYLESFSAERYRLPQTG